MDKKKYRSSSSGKMRMPMIAPMEKSKPMFSVDEKDLPAIKDWKVGETYDVSMTVKMKSLSHGSDWGGSGTALNARFEIQSVETDADEDAKEPDEADE